MKNLYESILSDIETTLDKADSKVVMTILFGDDLEAKRNFRDDLYADVIKSEKRISRRSQISDDTLYIQFMKGKYDKREFEWGFRIGTCNKGVQNDIVAMPNLYTKPASYQDKLSGTLRLDSYLSHTLYKLPKNWHWLYYDLKEKANKLKI